MHCFSWTPVSHYAFHFPFWATAINENWEEDTSCSFHRNSDCQCLMASPPSSFSFIWLKILLFLFSYPLPGLIQLHSHSTSTLPVFEDIILPSSPSLCQYTSAFLCGLFFLLIFPIALAILGYPFASWSCHAFPFFPKDLKNFSDYHELLSDWMSSTRRLT